jgi:hypothetical protein
MAQNTCSALRARALTARIVLLASVLLPLAACGSGGDLARNIGLTRDAPDEFTVSTRAPLSMPPDFSLPAPIPGATRPQEQSAPASAAAALSPQTALATQSNAATSAGEAALLSAAGPAVPSSIRNQVDREASLEANNRGFTDKLMFWKSAPPPGVVVDPQREAQRLRENAALGQSVQSGDTPIIQRKKEGLLDRLF